MKKIVLGIMSFFVPVLAFAQITTPQTSQGDDAITVLENVGGVLDVLIPILIKIGRAHV